MSKYDLEFRTPILNAAGTLGFAPDPDGPVDLEELGAFVTNPISLGSRSPAHNAGVLPFAGGFLLHSGYPNPGLERAVKRYARRWADSPAPVIVHLLCGKVEETAAMTRRLEGLEGVMGVELGMPPEIDGAGAAAFARAARGELPVIVRLPLERAGALALETMGSAEGSIAAFSLAPARGVMPRNRLPLNQSKVGGEPGKPEVLLAAGRLYGPGLFPLALAAVAAVGKADLPVIGAGGIYERWQAEAMLAAGAVAVQVDAALWRGTVGGWGLEG